MNSVSENYLQIAKDFIKDNHLLVLATADAGHINTSPIYYLFEDDFTFNVLFKSDSHKYNNLISDPQVAFTILNEKDQTAVDARAVAHEVDNFDELKKTIDGFLAKVHKEEFAWPPPVDKLDLGELKSFKLDVSWMRYSNFDYKISPKGFVVKEFDL